MKTIIKKYLVAVTFLLSLVSYATEKNISTTIDGKKVKVEFTAVRKGQVLSIKNANNIVMYSDVIEMAGNYARTFDLTNLENGKYTAELEKDFETIIKPFLVANGLVTFTPEENKTIFKPVIRTQDNLLLISKISLKNQPIKITLYYMDAVIYTETSKDTKVLNRALRLLKNKKGTYTVAINADNKNYRKNFKI
ncbi:MAG: hypothetical protein ACI9H1_000127 [Polaribacter sp.]|jgi:hypothetical protein